MAQIHVKGLDELVAKLRELASGKYLDEVVQRSRRRLSRTVSDEEGLGADERGFFRARPALIGRQGIGPRQVISLQQGSLQEPMDAILATESKLVEADLVDAVEKVLEG